MHLEESEERGRDTDAESGVSGNLCQRKYNLKTKEELGWYSVGTAWYSVRFSLQLCTNPEFVAYFYPRIQEVKTEGSKIKHNEIQVILAYT